jgi:hypothetical protein
MENIGRKPGVVPPRSLIQSSLRMWANGSDAADTSYVVFTLSCLPYVYRDNLRLESTREIRIRHTTGEIRLFRSDYASITDWAIGNSREWMSTTEGLGRCCGCSPTRTLDRDVSKHVSSLPQHFGVHILNPCLPETLTKQTTLSKCGLLHNFENGSEKLVVYSTRVAFLSDQYCLLGLFQYQDVVVGHP